MGIINPETGAIANYKWVTAQEGIKTYLEAVSTAQAIKNPAYAFKVEKNLYRPTIESIYNVSLVNILIASVTSDGNETNFSKNHIVTFHIDCYVRGQNEDNPDAPGTLVPADEVAVERLHYLCAMVEYGLTNLANFYQSLNSGEIMPDKISLIFNPVDDPANNADVYAPARFQFVCKFPYVPQDLQNLPSLAKAFVDLGPFVAKILDT
jgi:hypothetical protein